MILVILLGGGIQYSTDTGDSFHNMKNLTCLMSE